MSSHIQLVEDGRLIGLDGGAWASTPVNAWSGFPCEIHPHMRHGEVKRRYNPHPLVFLRFGACGRSRIVSGSRAYDLDVAPLQIDVFPEHFPMDYGWWNCTPGQLVSIELNRHVLASLAPGEESTLLLRTMLSGFDQTLVELISCMRGEIAQGCPSGKLFADGLSLALLARVHAAHAERPVDRAGDRLTARARALLVDYIDANLGTDLRIATLASLVRVSGQYFIRIFRSSFGRTPHRYVTERRLESAQRMLLAGRPIAGVAYALGFSSQAHFTKVFRDHCGVTPGRFRRDPPNDAAGVAGAQARRIS